MWYLPKFFGSLPLLFLCLDLRFHGTVGMMNSQVYSSLPALLIVAWTTMLGDVKGNGDVDKHLEMGNKMLAAGQLADALSHYHAAIELDPTNYKLFYRRATVYLAMGKSKSALPDLDTVIQLKPDFTSARLQRGSVKLKQGKLDEARTDFEQVILKDKGNTEAQEKLNLIGPLQESIQDAEDFFRDGEYPEAIGILTSAIETCPWDIHLRELRASCYEAVGDYFKAVHDIRPTTKLRSDNTAGHYRISKLYYEMGEAEESLNEIRECLKLDPDHKECHPHYKKVKKLVKQLQSILDFRNEQRWEDCLGKVAQAQKTEPDVRAYVRRATEHNCHCHSKAGHHKEAMEACDTVLSYDEKNIEALCDKAEALILNEEFEEAVNLYKKAEETAGELRRVQDGLKRAQKLLKQSLKRDYYKILGVKRNADKKEIMKAYRKLAVQWHPDKYDGDDKAKAEKMFYDIAAAKEVLSDPEMRAKFDNGEDPLDPEEQAHHGHGGHPFFHQGFNPFGGGGGFNFKFNYN